MTNKEIISMIEQLALESAGLPHKEDRLAAREELFKEVKRNRKLARFAHGAAEIANQEIYLNLLKKIFEISGKTAYAQDRNLLFRIVPTLMSAIKQDMSVEALTELEWAVKSARRSAESWRNLAVRELHEQERRRYEPKEKA